MLNKQERAEWEERIKFWKELFPLISSYRGLKFEEAKKTINYYKHFFADNPRNLKYYFWLIRDIGWLRDEIDTTQKGKEKYDEESKDLITELNKLVLIIIGNIMNFSEEGKEKVLWEANLKFEPIFTEKEVPKEGFAYFGKIEIDMDYYKEVYFRLIEVVKREYPKFRKQLEEYQKWNKEQNQKLAKEWGFKK